MRASPPPLLSLPLSSSQLPACSTPYSPLLLLIMISMVTTNPPSTATAVASTHSITTNTELWYKMVPSSRFSAARGHKLTITITSTQHTHTAPSHTHSLPSPSAESPTLRCTMLNTRLLLVRVNINYHMTSHMTSHMIGHMTKKVNHNSLKRWSHRWPEKAAHRLWMGTKHDTVHHTEGGPRCSAGRRGT